MGASTARVFNGLGIKKPSGGGAGGTRLFLKHASKLISYIEVTDDLIYSLAQPGYNFYDIANSSSTNADWQFGLSSSEGIVAQALRTSSLYDNPTCITIKNDTSVSPPRQYWENANCSSIGGSGNFFVINAYLSVVGSSDNAIRGYIAQTGSDNNNQAGLHISRMNLNNTSTLISLPNNTGNTFSASFPGFVRDSSGTVYAIILYNNAIQSWIVNDSSNTFAYNATVSLPVTLDAPNSAQPQPYYMHTDGGNLMCCNGTKSNAQSKNYVVVYDFLSSPFNSGIQPIGALEYPQTGNYTKSCVARNKNLAVTCPSAGKLYTWGWNGSQYDASPTVTNGTFAFMCFGSDNYYTR